MTKIKDLALFLCFAVAFGIGSTLASFALSAYVHSSPSITLGGGLDVPGFNSVGANGTSTSVVVTTSSTRVLATSTDRTYVVITPGIPMYCNLNADKPAVLGNGIYMASGTVFILNQNENSLYRGSIQCISANVQGTTSIYSH